MKIIPESKQSVADVNEDGKITKIDAQLILNYVVGNINKLPHPCKSYKEEYEKESEYTHYKITKCACGLKLAEEREEHTFLNGKCICGVISECRHTRFEYNYKNAGSTKHQNTIICNDCGKTLQQVMEPHVVESGKCICGAFVECSHTRIEYYFVNMSNGKKQAIKRCKDCGETL